MYLSITIILKKRDDQDPMREAIYNIGLKTLLKYCLEIIKKADTVKRVLTHHELMLITGRILIVFKKMVTKLIFLVFGYSLFDQVDI